MGWVLVEGAGGAPCSHRFARVVRCCRVTFDEREASDLITGGNFYQMACGGVD